MRKTADSCYFKKDIKYNQYKALEKDIKTDVLVIGGGVAGALTAYILKEHNINAVLVEKGTVGTGSTVASTSLLHYEIDTDLTRLSGMIGQDKATEAFIKCLNAVKQLKEIIQNVNEDCDFIIRPSFYYTYKDEEYDYLYDEYLLRKSIGLNVEFFDGEKHKDRFTFPFVAGIFSHEDGAEVNPVKLTNALLSYCHSKGMDVYENTEVIEYCLEGHKPVVKTRDGVSIVCNKIIHSCGYDNLPFINEDLYNMTRTFVLTTKPVKNFEGWYQRCLIKDTTDSYTYIRTTTDDRIIIGGEDIEITPHDQDKLNMDDLHGFAKQKYHILKLRLDEYFPLIKDKIIEHEYNGIFVDSIDGLPFIGQMEDYPNIYFNTGIGSNGLLYSLIGANTILEQYLGISDDSQNIFSHKRIYG